MPCTIETRKVQREWEARVVVGTDGRYFSQTNEMEKWCEETFGSGGRHHRYRWRRNWTIPLPIRFYFKAEKDLVAFLLRWS